MLLVLLPPPPLPPVAKVRCTRCSLRCPLKPGCLCSSGVCVGAGAVPGTQSPPFCHSLAAELSSQSGLPVLLWLICAGAVPGAHHPHPRQPREPADHAGAAGFLYWLASLSVLPSVLWVHCDGSTILGQPRHAAYQAGATARLHLPGTLCLRVDLCRLVVAAPTVALLALLLAFYPPLVCPRPMLPHCRSMASMTSACASTAVSTCGATAPMCLTTCPCRRS